MNKYLCGLGYLAALALCAVYLAWVALSVEGIQGGVTAVPGKTLTLPVEKPAWSEQEPEPEPTDWSEEAAYIARTLYGEARGCSAYEQEQVVWCILNRVDDSRFPGTVQEVVTQRGQFYGYSPEHPMWDSLYALAWDVLERWEAERDGADSGRNLGPEYLWFSGDGTHNIFRAG